ncbi:hypothetical protein [Micromonospora sp. NPDC048830]|uniref:hypothetical protein n=1 Tax=Micromonospora sp. NPDC048830 TaxID=3364257 RepID=UPI003717AF13
MEILNNSFVQASLRLPILLVLVVGLVVTLMARKRLPGRCVAMLVFGVLASFLGVLVDLTGVFAMPHLYRSGAVSFSTLTGLGTAIGLLSIVFGAVGLALLFAAAVAGRQPSTPR